MKLLRLSTLMLLALALVLSLTPRSEAAAARVAVLHLDAPRQVAVGEVIEVTLTMRDSLDLAGYETALLFDTTAAEFAGLRQRDTTLAGKDARWRPWR